MVEALAQHTEWRRESSVAGDVPYKLKSQENRTAIELWMTESVPIMSLGSGGGRGNQTGKHEWTKRSSEGRCCGQIGARKESLTNVTQVKEDPSAPLQHERESKVRAGQCMERRRCSP